MSDIPLLVDGDWLEARLDDPQLRLYDATAQLAFPDNDRDGYYRLTSGRPSYGEEHIPRAAFADLLLELADPNAKNAFTVPPSELFAERIGALGVSNDNYVVVYDQFDPTRSDKYYQHWAGRLWWQLRLEGFDHVAVLDGGLFQWKREGRQRHRRVHLSTAKFAAKRRPELIADRIRYWKRLTATMSCSEHRRSSHTPRRKNTFSPQAIS